MPVHVVMLVALVVLGATAFGYSLRICVEQRWRARVRRIEQREQAVAQREQDIEQRELEKVVAALGGGDAQSEEVARGLEAAALKEAHKGYPTASASLLQQARDTRAAARKAAGR